jgi:hypothetical protein
MPTRLHRKASFSSFGTRKTTLATVQRSIMKTPISGSESPALSRAEESKLPTANHLGSTAVTPIVPRARMTGETTEVQASGAQRASLIEPPGSRRFPQWRSRSSFKSAPVSFIAPRTASRWAVAFTAAAEYRPCSAVSRNGDASVARHEQSTRLFCRQMQARHNPSLNHRTRYGGLSWPGLRYAVHFRSPGQAIPPQRAG